MFIQDAVHAWLSLIPPPDNVQLFNIVDLYETMGLWHFTYQGEQYMLTPKRCPPQFHVSLPPSEVYRRGECIVATLGAFDASTIVCQAKSADICVAAYLPEDNANISFVLIVFGSSGVLTTSPDQQRERIMAQGTGTYLTLH